MQHVSKDSIVLRFSAALAAYLLCSPAASADGQQSSTPLQTPTQVTKEELAKEEKLNPHHRLDEGYGALTTGEFINLKGSASPMVSGRAMWVLGEEFGYGYEVSTLVNPKNPLSHDSDPLKRGGRYHYSQWGFVFEHILDEHDNWHPVYGFFLGFGVGGVSNPQINKLPTQQHERYEDEFSDKHMAVLEPRISIDYNAGSWTKLSYGAALRLVYGGRAGTAVDTKDGSGIYGFVAVKVGNVGVDREEQDAKDAKDKADKDKKD